MTNVWISHNPFSAETEMIIDGYPIAETSRLYKYIKTPMQDWVGNFLPMLVEHCNDEELCIVFEGLPHNYEDLESELVDFRNKNRDYEIDLQYHDSPGMAQRLAERDAILAQMKTQDAIPDVLLTLLTKKHDTVFQVLIFGGNEDQCRAQEDRLALVCKDSGKIKVQRISDLESVKEAVESRNKPLLMCIVDEFSGEKENTKIIRLISDAYRVRGKTNKWRFLFVADNPLYAKRVLSSDFAIKNAEVYALDEPERICQRIREYRDEVWQVRQLADYAEDLSHRLSILKQRLATQAEQVKKTQQIDELEDKALKIVDSYTLKYSIDQFQLEKNIYQYFKVLREEFLNTCLYDSKKRPILGEYAKEKVDKFLKELPKALRQQLLKQALNFYYLPDADTQQVIRNVNYEEILSRFGCVFFLKDILAMNNLVGLTRYPNSEGHIQSVESKRIVYELKKSGSDNSGANFDPFQYALYFTSELAFSIHCITYPPLNSDYKESRRAEYELYAGMKMLICSNIENVYSSLTKEEISLCEQTFNREIKRFHEAFFRYLDACISQGEKEFQRFIPDFEAKKTRAREQIKEKAEEMRRKAQISEVQKQRLEQIQQLIQRAKALTELY